MTKKLKMIYAIVEPFLIGESLAWAELNHKEEAEKVSRGLAHI
jgi:hypothetical protein